MDSCKRHGEEILLKKKRLDLNVFSVFFHPNFSRHVVGGAEKRFIEIVKASSKHGVKFTILETAPTILLEISANCEKHEVHEPLEFQSRNWNVLFLKWILWSLRACPQSVSITKKRKCNLIVAPNNTLPNLLPSLFASLASHAPLCVVVHHIDVLSPDIKFNIASVLREYKRLGYSGIAAFIKGFAFFMSLQLLKHCQCCIAVSEFTAKNLMTNGVPKEKIFVSCNGVDFRHINRSKAAVDQNFDAVFVGRIAKEKGVFDLIPIWQKLVKEKPHAKLAIVGVGPETDKLRTAIQQSGLENNIIVRGYCPEKELYALVKSCKVFVFPSRFEGWGLAVAEALACGLPVVCYNIPALKEVFGKCKSVFLITEGDTVQFASQINELLEKSNDEIKRAAKAYAKMLNWSHVVLKDLDAMLECVCH